MFQPPPTMNFEPFQNTASQKSMPGPPILDSDFLFQIRPMMYVALTYDHRLIDGREAVTFLKGIKQKVEDPRRLLLDL